MISKRKFLVQINNQMFHRLSIRYWKIQIFCRRLRFFELTSKYLFFSWLMLSWIFSIQLLISWRSFSIFFTSFREQFIDVLLANSNVLIFHTQTGDHSHKSKKNNWPQYWLSRKSAFNDYCFWLKIFFETSCFLSPNMISEDEKLDLKTQTFPVVFSIILCSTVSTTLLRSRNTHDDSLLFVLNCITSIIWAIALTALHLDLSP